MEQNPFVGEGTRHPDNTPDMPLGLGMELALDMDAMSEFGKLSRKGKEQIIQYIQAPKTGDEVKMRIRKVVTALHKHEVGFINGL